ncbi:MAG: transcriptional regulator [Thermoplasmata archaeon]|nr:MAG: transcriptional regulator [Thermoplasmata archaeon]
MNDFKTPCEQILWYIIPAIRKEIAKNLIEKHGLSQKKVADILGVTPAAISQYLSRKRGNFMEIKDDNLLEEIEVSNDRILKNRKNLVPEICRICQLIRKSKNVKINLPCE